MHKNNRNPLWTKISDMKQTTVMQSTTGCSAAAKTNEPAPTHVRWRHEFYHDWGSLILHLQCHRAANKTIGDKKKCIYLQAIGLKLSFDSWMYGISTDVIWSNLALFTYTLHSKGHCKTSRRHHRWRYAQSVITADTHIASSLQTRTKRHHCKQQLVLWTLRVV